MIMPSGESIDFWATEL